MYHPHVAFLILIINNRGNFVLNTSHLLFVHTFVFYFHCHNHQPIHHHQPHPPPPPSPSNLTTTATVTVKSITSYDYHPRTIINNDAAVSNDDDDQTSSLPFMFSPPLAFTFSLTTTFIASLLPSTATTFTYSSRSALLHLCFSRSAFLKGR